MRGALLALGMGAWVACAACSETAAIPESARALDSPSIPPISPIAPITPGPGPAAGTAAQEPEPPEPEAPRAPDAGAVVPPDDEDAGEASEIDASLPDAGPSQPVPCSPERLPIGGEACPTEGELCSNWSTDPRTGYDSYRACICVAASSTELLWDCFESASGQLQCPDDEPANASSCYGYKGQRCPYPPRVTCVCPEAPNQDQWQCEEPAAAPAAPPALPAATPVRALSDAQRQAFCSWYVDATVPDGFPLPPMAEPDADGFYPDTGCTGCGGSIAYDAMIPQRLPVSACVANLAQSSCELPLSELVDCVRSLLASCWPSPRGCGRFLEAPGCSGTIATRYNVNASDGAPDCRVKVRP